MRGRHESRHSGSPLTCYLHVGVHGKDELPVCRTYQINAFLIAKPSCKRMFGNRKSKSLVQVREADSLLTFERRPKSFLFEKAYMVTILVRVIIMFRRLGRLFFEAIILARLLGCWGTETRSPDRFLSPCCVPSSPLPPLFLSPLLFPSFVGQ